MDHHILGEKRQREEIKVGAYSRITDVESDQEDLDLPPPPLAAGLCEVDGVVIPEAMAKLIPSNVAVTTLIFSPIESNGELFSADVHSFVQQFGSCTVTDNVEAGSVTATFSSKAGAVRAFIGCHPRGILPDGVAITCAWPAEPEPVTEMANNYADAPPALDKLPYGLLPTVAIFPQDEKAPLAFTYAYLYTVFARYHPYAINMTPDKKAVYCSVHSEADAAKAVEQLGPIFSPRGYLVEKTLM